MREYQIAAIGGDGIGTEVVEEGIRVIQAIANRYNAFKIEVSTFPWGTDYYLKYGEMMAPDGLEVLKKFDAIYFGSAGDPRVPDHISLWGLRLEICQSFDQYANVRPSRLLPGISSPLQNVTSKDIDWIIVRENTEGEYAGAGGRVHKGHPEEVGMDVSVFTRTGVKRIQKFALDLARSRKAKKLTLVTKSNAQRHGMVLWDDIFDEVSADYTDVEIDRMLVDAMTTRMVLHPASIDVVVATNLHADILSDLAAALSGSMGIAPTANLNPEEKFPSMFEPIHGSAFDIMGKGIANPIGAFWSASMMLDQLGERRAAKQLMTAIERFTREGKSFPFDLGGDGKTRDVTDRIIEIIDGQNH
ncbi:MAG: tartrate dehydrogenase [Rhodospirillaceae bacterium]|nr:tartrate dehydrogenase [Rhodospirillaceae bacterium]|tara:strand:- start:1236 stop:2312 length:1077 start_codon:yes stop_codon:yes gene_type:complete